MSYSSVPALGPAASKRVMWKAACGRESFGRAFQATTAHESSADCTMVALPRN